MPPQRHPQLDWGSTSIASGLSPVLCGVSSLWMPNQVLSLYHKYAKRHPELDSGSRKLKKGLILLNPSLDTGSSLA